MEPNCPAVSVIIPVYNVEKYLRECLDSAVNQTLKNIEIICVNDGSPDHSADIAAEYAQKYDNVKLLHKENGGLSSARNFGLEHATGQYAYFLDSDDILERNTLEELYTKSVAENLDIVYFNAVPFFECKEDRKANASYIEFYKRNGDYSGAHTGQSMFAKMRKNHEFLGSACLQLIRRSLIEDNGLRFYDGILHEDNLFSVQCAMLAQRVGYINKEFYLRRMHGGSIMTTSKSIKNVEGYLVSYSEMLHFLHDLPIEESAFPMVSDYLYTSIWGNACSILQSLDVASEDVVLHKGGFCASYFLDTLKRSTDTEYERSALKAENDYLRKELQTIENQYETSFTFRVGRIVTLIPRLIVRIIRCLRENGLVFTVHKIIDTIAQKMKAIDERAQKSTFYQKLTSVPRKMLRGIRWLRDKGAGYACRILWLKLRTKFSGATPYVSIILPVYNVEAYLEQCIDSLLNQTMKGIEIIAVDDGSTDRSLAILNQYAATDKRVRVFSQQNKYAGAARNLGLSHAKGEYVIFLDSDDFFEKNLAKDAYLAGKAADADIVLFGAKHYNNATGEYIDAKWLLNDYLAPKKQPFSYKDCPKELYHITTPCPWTKMFRRQFVLDSGLQFQQIQNSNDLFFTFSALPMAKRIVTLNKELVNYRIGLSANLQTTKKKHPHCFYEAYSAWHDKLAELGVLEELRQSYSNLALSGCIFNLRTIRDPDAKREVAYLLKYKAFDSLELTGHDESYYSNKEYYKEMIQLIESRNEYEYFEGLDPSEYEDALKAWFKRRTSQELNLENPVTYNEKIQWIKLYENNPLKTKCSDKYEVREYVRQKIGEKYLVPLLGVWENVDDIDFDELPDRFVFKAVHGSGWNIIVNDKASLDVEAAKKKLNYWMKRKLPYCNGLELHYMDIKPRIIAEQYLENNGGDLFDYKVWCFNGKAHFIMFLAERKTGLKMAFYDRQWNKLPFIYNCPQYEKDVERPSNLEELIWAAETLAKPFNHVRVDFYRLDNGSIKFGELTFTSSSGRCLWNPPEYNKMIGDLFDLNYPNGLSEQEKQ